MKYKWVETTKDKGFKKDPWGFTCINISRLIHTRDWEEHEPYIEASQAEMVYYVNNEVHRDWATTIHVKPRDFYDIGEWDINVYEVEACP